MWRIIRVSDSLKLFFFLFIFSIPIIFIVEACKKNVCSENLPTPVLEATGATGFCPGGSVVLHTLGFEAGKYDIQWQLNEVDIKGANSTSYTATQNGNYQVKISEKECLTHQWSSPMQVIVNADPFATITVVGGNKLCSGKSPILYANTCQDYKYQWSKDGVVIDGATQSTYQPTTPGSYQVQITAGTQNFWSGAVSIVGCD